VSEAEEPELTEYTLALGGTRPALMPYLNMPWIDFVVFLMAGIECLLFRWQLLVLVVIPFLCSLTLYRKDYNAGRCFLCWLSTSGRHLAASTLGGTFLSPAPAARSPIFRGIISDGS
jgi:type IV secretory pathway VirB3-like protein